PASQAGSLLSGHAPCARTGPVRPIQYRISLRQGVLVMRDSSKRWFAVGVAAMTLGAFHSSVKTEQAAASSIDLTTLFAPGGVLQDRNGDNIVDFVNARLVLRERPGAADVSAASDIAARL